MDALRTLEILITSRTPLIAIETLEEERVEQALERVAQGLRIPLFVWTMTVIAGMKKEILSRDRVLDCVPEEEGLDDVGGLHGLKAWIEKRRNAFTPEAKQFGVEAPRGILLLGVQGCGKSLAAKAVAKAWGLPLLRLEPGRLFGKFVGESEQNLDPVIATEACMGA